MDGVLLEGVDHRALPAGEVEGSGAVRAMAESAFEAVCVAEVAVEDAGRTRCYGGAGRRSVLNVLDASALLASPFSHREPGADFGAEVLASGDAEGSAVNWWKVVKKLASLGVTPEKTQSEMASRGLTEMLRIVPFERVRRVSWRRSI